MEALYTAIARATDGGRNGHVETTDGLLKFDMSVPKGMQGPGEPGKTNPEQLFACGYSACFAGALEAAAKKKNHSLKTITVIAEVSIGKDSAGKLGLAVELKIYLPELKQDEANAVAKDAHQICPYSSATRGNIDVKLTIVDKI